MKLTFKSLSEADNKTLTSILEEAREQVKPKVYLKLIQTLDAMSSFNFSKEIFDAVILACKYEEEVLGEDEFKSFDKNTQNLVNSICAIDNLDFESYHAEVENIRTMFLSMNKDFTIVLITFAKVLVNLRNLSEMPAKKQALTCKYTQEIYAPLASRLGLSDIKGEMEDLCLKYYHPDEYKALKDEIETTWQGSASMIKQIKNILLYIIHELNIEGRVLSRQKRVSSVYKKLQDKKLSTDKIYDYIAFRVIVKTKEQCYAVLSKISEKFESMEGRFKDYIVSPKENGYQSLHNTVLYNGMPVEIQIRTEEMHYNNEFGVASHFSYKEKGARSTKADKKLLWIRSIMERNKKESSENFVEALKVDLYDGKILVNTPKGNIIELPAGSCVLDFAYAIHSGIGNKCSGALVNGKFVKVSTVLNNNDVVEIVTNPQSKGPSRDWLTIVKSSEARSKINQFFKKETRATNIIEGKNFIEKYLNSRGYKLDEGLNLIDQDRFLHKYSVKSLEDLYALVGYGSIKPDLVAGKLVKILDDLTKKDTKPQLAEEKQETKPRKKGAIVVNGDSDLLYRFASCCHPINGDEIVGYASRGRGVTIHRADCSNLKYLEKERIMDASWAEIEANNYVDLQILTNNEPGILAKISQIIANLKYNIVKISMEGKGLMAEINLTIDAKNKQQIDRLLDRLNALSYVAKAKRL